jgi:Uma2 family endonuclease
MVQALTSALTFADYCQFQDGSETRYELVRGHLLTMTPPSASHLRIAKYIERRLDAEIECLGLPWETFREAGQRTEARSSRLPDVMVVPRVEADALCDRSVIFEQPALLVVAVVSPSTWQDDYIYKLTEYEALGIPEYWIINHLPTGTARHLKDIQEPTVSVYQLIDGSYRLSWFRAPETLCSQTFPALALKADDIFKAAI